MYKKVAQDMLKLKNYKVQGELPNPFVFDDGHLVKTTDDWEKRRNEMMRPTIDLQFGGMPPSPNYYEVEILNIGKTQRSYKIHTGTKQCPLSFLVKIILPNGENRPMIINGDMCAGYFMEDGFIRAATDRNVGWVFFDRTEIAHDIASEGRGNGAIFNTYPNSSFGTISAWAWGYSRCIDLLEKINLPQIDLSCIVFTGHSRGGKAALLAGAMDKRAYITNPNEACLGGGGCYRFYMKGDYLDLPSWSAETLKDIWANSSFWFGNELGKYVDKESELPFDSHYLKSMIAPRVLFVSEAAGDIWANPVGSWLTTIAAKEVFNFLNAEKNLFWYYRAGTHHHNAQDIEMLVNIICHIHDGDSLNDNFYSIPFEPIPLIHNWVAPKNKSIKE